jgi:hypothetical protein
MSSSHRESLEETAIRELQEETGLLCTDLEYAPIMSATLLKFPIYRIDTYIEGSNVFGISRQECWDVKYVKTSDTFEDAQEYIRQESHVSTDLALFIQQWKETKPEDRTITMEKLINDFCFDDATYLQYRRIFIGFPPVENMKQQLKHNGIRVI